MIDATVSSLSLKWKAQLSMKEAQRLCHAYMVVSCYMLAATCKLRARHTNESWQETVIPIFLQFVLYIHVRKASDQAVGMNT